MDAHTHVTVTVTVTGTHIYTDCGHTINQFASPESIDDLSDTINFLWRDSNYSDD